MKTNIMPKGEMMTKEKSEIDKITEKDIKMIKRKGKKTNMN